MNLPATPNCKICGHPLSGKQTAFCSRVCKNKNTNFHHQSYVKQLERGRTRKLKLLMKSGGQCVACGYARNLAALEFHHVDPLSKSFQLDMRSLVNRNWNEVEIEARKCVLLCSNCHAEHHNPGSFINGV